MSDRLSESARGRLAARLEAASSSRVTPPNPPLHAGEGFSPPVRMRVRSCGNFATHGAGGTEGKPPRDTPDSCVGLLDPSHPPLHAGFLLPLRMQGEVGRG
ncbi:hypothetical protein GCM10007167_06540 [Vulcaniibacterium thermophilum]|uniref:Uncharacterized protein n=1 Tax=Vulcaniibacterium thermophilum TaxID=1169913 RepID=A0A918YXC4_9GAMM|nr:hypothetical protein GCM10007167_06540 [Vulcaniibacterium thermophilum]